MKTIMLAALFAITTLVTGCASIQDLTGSSQGNSQGSTPGIATSTQGTTPAPAEGIVGVPAKNSKFSKLQLGMSYEQVLSLVGKPTDDKRYLTPKAFIPFYFAADSNMYEAFYAKEGILTFEGGGYSNKIGKLLRIEVNVKAVGTLH
jgi:uncharacterized protein YceK